MALTKRRRHTTEQVMRKLRDGEVAYPAGWLRMNNVLAPYI